MKEKWISVLDELPPLGERVLVCFSGGGFVCEAWRAINRWHRYDGYDIEDDIDDVVSHWMFMPKAPESYLLH